MDTLDVYLDMIALLKQQLTEAQAREQAALERERTARDREALVLQMLQDMQHRYDRLLDTPRSPPPPRPQEAPGATQRPTPAPRPPAHQDTPQRPRGGQQDDPRGAMRRQIVALLHEHPEGLTPGEMQDLLGVERSLVDTCQGMLRYGLVQRVERGRYVAAPELAGP